VSKAFSAPTLEKFEKAAASIPLRQLDRAFDAAGIRLGTDPGGPAGSRRAQFRRYVASVDQRDARQLEGLGDALGALIGEVAESKVEFLVKAAGSDGFFFADGTFRAARAAAGSLAVARVEDVALIEERGRQLFALASDSPKAAVDGAKELVDSMCRTVLRLLGKRQPAKKAGLVDIATSTLDALELDPAGATDARKGSARVRKALLGLSAVVAELGELSKGLSPRHARLAVGAAVAFAAFVAETYSDGRNGR
jgi:hypothetical protein